MTTDPCNRCKQSVADGFDTEGGPVHPWCLTEEEVEELAEDPAEEARHVHLLAQFELRSEIARFQQR